jgi:1-acyl-sn-glycerol-3-phosphate acyltransferase
VEAVKASDWLRGTVRAIYGVSGSAAGAEDYEQLARAVALREHAAQRLGVHPSQVAEQAAEQVAEDAGAEGGEIVRAVAATHPLNPLLLRVARSGAGWQVSDVAGADHRLDTEGVQAYWRGHAHSQDTLVEDLTLALLRRFVRSIEIVDPQAFAALHGRGVLYLANHQLDIESVLFVSAIASLQGTVTTAIARQELHESWVGPYFDICFQHPQIQDLNMLLLIDRGSPEAVLQSLAGAVERAAREANSLLIHVEGKHALQAGQEVQVVSTSLIDLAVANGVPIVPLRFSGGLPLEPVAEPLAFPFGYGKQNFAIGAPILPAVLAPLSSAARKVLVLDALNDFGGRRDETPSAGDEAFAAAVAAWRQERGVSEVQAALWCTLQEVTNPSSETQALRALANGDAAAVEGLGAARRRWLTSAAEGLFGFELEQLPSK